MLLSSSCSTLGCIEKFGTVSERCGGSRERERDQRGVANSPGRPESKEMRRRQSGLRRQNMAAWGHDSDGKEREMEEGVRGYL